MELMEVYGKISGELLMSCVFSYNQANFPYLCIKIEKTASMSPIDTVLRVPFLVLPNCIPTYIPQEID